MNTRASALFFLLVAQLVVTLSILSSVQAQNPMKTETPAENEAVATFAGGCFWCMQPPYDNTPGVLKTYVGYTGGHVKDPSYEAVSRGTTGHTEAIRVIYDSSKVSYEKLLDVFWRNIDPTQEDGQFADRGSQYRTGIFFHSPEQERLARASKDTLQKSAKFGRPIVTEISPAGDFYRAEEDHQGYYKKNSVHYNLYKLGSGRAGFIEKNWK